MGRTRAAQFEGGQDPAAEFDEEGGGEAPAETRRSAAIAKAQANLPRGETVMTAAPDDNPSQPPPVKKPSPSMRRFRPNAPPRSTSEPNRAAFRDGQAPRLGRARERRQIFARRFGRTGAGIGERRRRANAVERAVAAAPAAGFGHRLDTPLPPTRPMELAFEASEARRPPRRTSRCPRLGPRALAPPSAGAPTMH